MDQITSPVEAVPCDGCGSTINALWYQIRVEEFYSFDCTSRNAYVICEKCFPKIAQVLWVRQAQEEFSAWAAQLPNTD